MAKQRPARPRSRSPSPLLPRLARSAPASHPRTRTHPQRYHQQRRAPRDARGLARAVRDIGGLAIRVHPGADAGPGVSGAHRDAEPVCHQQRPGPRIEPPGPNPSSSAQSACTCQQPTSALAPTKTANPGGPMIYAMSDIHGCIAGSCRKCWCKRSGSRWL